MSKGERKNATYLNLSHSCFDRLSTNGCVNSIGVWTACAEAVGFRSVRTPDAYASTDGKGRLFIAVDGMFDPDDSLAQMIFHELWHALVEGEDGEKNEDWDEQCLRVREKRLRPSGHRQQW